jgi:tetratricopeptide (TPR) repeat protein
MTTLEAADHPLEFSCCATKLLSSPDAQIENLRLIALRFAATGTARDRKRAFDILDEARQIQTRQMEWNDYDATLDYPRFALDFNFIGHRERALDIIKQSVRYASSLKPRYEISMLIMVADACHSIGERERCMELVSKVGKFLLPRKRLLSNRDERYTVLLDLYLKLGRLEQAKNLTALLTGINKANALAAIAFYGEPVGRVYERCLHSALQYAKRSRSQNTVALIAGSLQKQGLPDRARTLIASIEKQYLSIGAARGVAVAMLDAGDITGALGVIEHHCGSPDVFFYGQSAQLSQLLPQVLPDHADAVETLIGRLRAKAEGSMTERDRFVRYSRLVGVVAAYSRTKAEELVDEILGASLADLDRKKDGKFYFNRAAAHILFEVAMAIHEHGLLWEGERMDKIRAHLESIPVHQGGVMGRLMSVTRTVQNVA